MTMRVMPGAPCCETGKTTGVQAAHANRLMMQLVALDNLQAIKTWISRVLNFTH
jgi:hypothetical protein